MAKIRQKVKVHIIKLRIVSLLKMIKVKKLIIKMKVK